MRLTLSSQLIPYVIKQASMMEWADRNKELAGMLLGAAGGTAVQGVRPALHVGPEEDAPSYLDGALTGGLLGAAGGGAMRLLRGRPTHSPEELDAARASGAKANPFNQLGYARDADHAFASEVRKALQQAQNVKGSPLTESEAMLAIQHLPAPRTSALTHKKMSDFAQSLLAGGGALTPDHDRMLSHPDNFRAESVRDLLLGLIGKGGSPLMKLPE